MQTFSNLRYRKKRGIATVGQPLYLSTSFGPNMALEVWLAKISWTTFLATEWFNTSVFIHMANIIVTNYETLWTFVTNVCKCFSVTLTDMIVHPSLWMTNVVALDALPLPTSSPWPCSCVVCSRSQSLGKGQVSGSWWWMFPVQASQICPQKSKQSLELF